MIGFSYLNVLKHRSKAKSHTVVCCTRICFFVYFANDDIKKVLRILLIPPK